MSLRNIPVAELRIAGRTDGRSYASTALVFTKGIAAVFADVRILAKARGWVTDNGLLPYLYQEEYTRSGSTKSRIVSYKAGALKSIESDPPEETDVDPGSEEFAGSIDPVTILFLSFLPFEKNAVCGRDFEVFDGKRLLTVSFGKDTEESGQLKCGGQYFLRSGFTEKELDTDESQFSVIFQKDEESEGLFRLQTVEARTRIGTVRIKRIPSSNPEPNAG